MLISIIVPIYNVELYLEKCIESIINQTYKNLEIILVDDGSTDSCGKICDEYAKKDNRIKVIHKINGGLSDARNKGMEIAKGKYIGFVDGDDYVASDMYETLYKFSVKNSLDVAMCNVSTVLNDRIIEYKYNSELVTDDKDRIIEEVFVHKGGGIAISVCNKLFKSITLKNLYFEYGKTSKDLFFALKWINNTERFGRIFISKYFYVQRRNSITHLECFSYKILDNIEACEKNLYYVRQFYKKSIPCAEYSFFIACKVDIIRIYDCIDCDKYYNIIKDIQDKLRYNLFKILNNKYINLKSKVGYLILVIDTRLYIYLQNIIWKIRENGH